MTLADELSARLAPGARVSFGELILWRGAENDFEARHCADEHRAAEQLTQLTSVRELREWAKFDSSGQYRPLKTAPNLRAGWRTVAENAEAFLARLDALYPGAFAGSVAYLRGDFPAVPLRETLDRQTGMYRLAGTISDEDAWHIRRELCGAGCLRQLVWPIDATTGGETLQEEPGRIPLLCLEACTFAVSFARELAKEARAQRHP